VVYVYVYSVFRSLNEGALIADFYRRHNRINGRTPTLSRLIKRIAGQMEERVKIKKKNQIKVNPFTRTTTTTVSVAMVCTYTNARTYIYRCSDVIVLCCVNNIHIATPHNNAGISRPFNMRDILIFTRYRYRGYNCAVTTVKNRAADKRHSGTLGATIPPSVTRLSRCIFYTHNLIVLTSFLYFFI